MTNAVFGEQYNGKELIVACGLDFGPCELSITWGNYYLGSIIVATPEDFEECIEALEKCDSMAIELESREDGCGHSVELDQKSEWSRFWRAKRL